MLGRSNKNQSFGLVATCAARSIPLLKVVGFPGGFDENAIDKTSGFSCQITRVNYTCTLSRTGIWKIK